MGATVTVALAQPRFRPVHALIPHDGRPQASVACESERSKPSGRYGQVTVDGRAGSEGAPRSVAYGAPAAPPSSAVRIAGISLATLTTGHVTYATAAPPATKASGT